VRHARDAGLRVHAYTFRRDDLPAYTRTLEELLALFLVDVGVDGVFSDHPDVAARSRFGAQGSMSATDPPTARRGQP
jgi:glycerophosphoryl diester phosphodiesterase